VLFTDDFVTLQKLASQFVPETTQGSSTRRRQPKIVDVDSPPLSSPRAH
jgi:hypothetical protein